VTYYRNGLFNLRSRDAINFMYHNLNLFIDEVRTWDGFEVITEKLESTAEKFENLGRKIYEPSSSSHDGFNVLNHGDFHFNNMLFKKNEEGKISDVLFVSLNF
jgi:thiamine kinase-like enzyme